MQTPLIEVVFYATITAVCTWLGALPFLFKKKLSKTWVAKANAIAAALMIAASFGLIYEGINLDPAILDGYENALPNSLWGITRETRWVVAGVLWGLAFIVACDGILEKYDDLQVYNMSVADAKKTLLIIAIMTLHSFTEGVAIGVSFTPSESFGIFIALALALHNIPEGLAISTVMVPRWVKWWKAGLWSVFSSLPQPIMAVPAFLFVQYFAPFLPFWLGFAAGAMLWMSLSELLPDALDDAPNGVVATIATIWIIAMILFQQILG